MLVVDGNAPAPVMEPVTMSRDPRFSEYFAGKGAQVSKLFEEMNPGSPVSAADRPGALWRRVLRKLRRVSRRLLRAERPA